MTREEALQGMSSSSARDRLEAARFFSRNCNADDLQFLQGALAIETVLYARRALELAIKRASDLAPTLTERPTEEIEVPPDFRARIRKEVTEEVTGQLLHEIGSLVGLIASAAAREIPVYERSRTKKQVDTLKRVFDAMEQLKGATAVPRPKEFDLAELLDEVVTEATEEVPIEISLDGIRPMLITSDRALLRLAISNGVRNAVEAVSGVPGGELHPVIVTWGKTDVDYWVSVLDRGLGLVGPAESAFDIGKTNKKGHSGFGLTIARQAIETLGGGCTLQPATNNGARFEIWWER